MSTAESWLAELPLAQLRLDGGTQMRMKLDPENLADCVRGYRAGERLPPLDAVFDGTHHWVWDGFHRHEALRLGGFRHAHVRVRKGTLRDAQFLAAGANAKHGLTRSNEDKRRSVLVILRDPEWCQMTGPQVADHCGVDPEMVRKYRKQVVAELLATAKGQKLSDAEVHRRTGTSIDLVRKARAERNQPPAGSAERRQDGPAGWKIVGGAEPLEDVLGDMTSIQRAIFEGLSPEEQEAELALANDQARESQLDVLERAAEAAGIDVATEKPAEAGAGGSAALQIPREVQVELLIRRIDALLQLQPLATRSLKALSDFQAVCRVELPALEEETRRKRAERKRA